MKNLQIPAPQGKPVSKKRKNGGSRFALRDGAWRRSGAAPFRARLVHIQGTLGAVAPWVLISHLTGGTGSRAASVLCRSVGTSVLCHTFLTRSHTVVPDIPMPDIDTRTHTPSLTHTHEQTSKQTPTSMLRTAVTISAA